MKSLGIIGCGAVTQKQYVKVLGLFHDITVNSVFDINADLAKSIGEQLGAKVATKEELINDNEIIVIATPPSTHFQLVSECFKPGKKIICEKPFVGTVAECNELVELAKKNGSELFVAHFRRNYPSVKLARSIIKSGVLGKVTGIEVYEGGKFSWITNSGYVYKDPLGGVLFDTGSHTIDMALFMADLDDVYLDTEIVSIQKDKEEPAHDIDAKLKLKKGGDNIDMRVKLSRRLLLANKVRIICESGYIDVPIIMTSYLRLSGQHGSTMLYTDTKYDDLMDCFAMQFKDMFYDVEDSIFSAQKFINLTKILEIISKN